MATFRGSKKRDVLKGTDGKDTLLGLQGDDKLAGGKGDDTLKGGPGKDSLKGGPGNDRLYGDAGDDKLWGEAGSDKLYGGAGKDKLQGGASVDLLQGGAGNDTLDGGKGSDKLDGGAGDDILIGGAGGDELIGGLGFDVADYSASKSGVAVMLFVPQFIVTAAPGYGAGFAGDAQGDTLVGIEGVKGSVFTDYLTAGNESCLLDGGGGNDFLAGSEFNDVLKGGSGDDIIQGDRGADVMSGGTGADIFLWQSPGSETGVGSGLRDIITDFESGIDRMQIDIPGSPAHFLGTAAFDGSLLAVRYETQGGATVVQIDFNGDQIANVEFELTGNVALTLSDFDFG